MTDLAAQIVVLADEPIPGRARPGIGSPFSAREAAALAGAALADTLAAVRRTRVVRRVLCLAGQPGPWLPDGFEVLVQRGRGLDERIAAAMWDTYTGLPLPIVLVGTGTPQVSAGLLEAATEPLARTMADAAFGPAESGGFWLLGLRRPAPGLTLGVPMGEPVTGRAQLVRLIQAGLRIHMTPELAGVDTLAEAARVARLAPGRRFATMLAATLGAPAELDEPVFGDWAPDMAAVS